MRRYDQTQKLLMTVNANDAAITSGTTGADLMKLFKGAAVYNCGIRPDAMTMTGCLYRGEFCDIISWGCYVSGSVRL